MITSHANNFCLAIKVFVSVTSDLSTDQRVHRASLSLHRQGYDVTLVGRQLRKSKPLENRPYQTKRLKLFFEKGALFYAEFNIRLFLYLVFKKSDLLLSNDLDTLVANYLTSKFRKTKLVYDCHEYFTGVPELSNRPFVRNTWKRIEKSIFPKLNFVYTVNESIAGLYKNDYGKKVSVVRNVPMTLKVNPIISQPEFRKKNNLPLNKKILILQGAGINIDRGAEEAVEAMQFIDDAVLLIIGGGDVIHVVQQLISKNNLQDKIIFKDKMPFEELRQFTQCCDLGLTLDKDTNINYRYSLPNKLFDYIHAGIPVLGSNLVEVKKIIEDYQVGEVISSHEPEAIAGKIKSMLSDPDKVSIWKANTVKAKRELCWEEEEKKFLTIIHEALG